MKKISVLIIIILYSAANVKGQNLQVPYLISNLPKYNAEKYIKLEKLYSIYPDDTSGKNSYFLDNIRMFDVDNDTNLYVPDFTQSKILLFDKKGTYIKELGGFGQGPRELMYPNFINIYNNNLYIYESNKGIKIFNLKGDYVDFFVKPHNNFWNYKVFDKSYLMVETVYNKKRGIFEPFLTIYTQDFKTRKEIYQINDGNDKNFCANYAYTMNSKNQFFCIADRDNYKIIVYNSEGKPLKSFGRKIDKIKYSSNMKKFWKDKNRKMLDYTPIVRMLFVDSLDNIWVVVGECSIDCDRNFPVESTIDIFDDNGNFLCSFKSSIFIYSSVIKHNRFYSMCTEYDSNINVYKITYLK